MTLGTMNLAAERLLLAVGQTSLTTALVILPLLAVRRLLRRRYPARVLCIVWAALVLRLLVPVQITLPEAPVKVTPRLTRVSYAQPANVPDGEPGDTGQPLYVYSNGWVETADVPEIENAVGATYIGVLLFLLWALVALLLLNAQLSGCRAYSKRLKRGAEPVGPGVLREAYRAECARLGLEKPPALCVSPGADGPMLAGLLRPVLYLPTQGVPEAAAPMVFRHELAHFQRRDLWLKLAAAAVRCVHWFNPAVYLLTRALYEDIELACDSRAVEGMDTEARKRYGMAILDCAASQCAASQPLTTCFTNDKEALRTRLGELFATGAKKRGIALLVACAIAAGIAGGAVYIGSDAQAEPAPAIGEEALQNPALTEEAAILLAGAWSDGWVGRNMETAMPYLTRDLQQIVFDSMIDPTIEDGTRFEFDPDDPHYGVPEEHRHYFWNVGMSSPWMRARAVIPDLENSAAYVVYNWTSSASPDHRSMEYVHFTWEDGAWRVSSVDNGYSGSVESGTAYGMEMDGVANSARNFQLLYGNDLGLPDYYPYWELALDYPEFSDHFKLDTPLTAAESLLELEGEGVVSGNVHVENPDGAPANWLGKSVHWTFPDGSEIDLVMASMYDSGLWIPVDWSIGGESQRSMLDLAIQWAHGTMNKDTHQMFPLLTENAAAELIAVQRNYSGEEDGTWHWKHGKYGSSPTAEEYGVYLEDDGTALIVYAIGDSGSEYYRVCERLRFQETPLGLKIDSVRELTNRENEQGGNCVYEYVPYSEKDWFALRFMQDFDTDNFPLTLGRFTSSHTPDGELVREYLLDPAETVREVLHIVRDGENRIGGWETLGDAALVSQAQYTAVVRIDFEGGGSVFADLDRNEESGCWGISALRDGEIPPDSICTAADFAYAYGAEGGNENLWTDVYHKAQETPWINLPYGQKVFSAGETGDIVKVFQLGGGQRITQTATERFGQPYGIRSEVVFDDGSKVVIYSVSITSYISYPVDWEIEDGKPRQANRMDAADSGMNTRGMRDLANQWAAAWQARDTKPMYAILSDEGAKRLYDYQNAGGGYYTDTYNWNWKLNEYNADGHGYTLREIDGSTMEIVYTENMHGCENFQAVQRVHFVTEGGGKLRIDSWEDVDVSGMPDYEKYKAYNLPSYPNFEKELYIGVLGTPEGMGEPDYAAYELAGCDPHQFWGVTVRDIDNSIRVPDEGGEWVPAYQVTLQFGDGSGFLRVVVRPREDEEGNPYWYLCSVQLVEEDAVLDG